MSHDHGERELDQFQTRLLSDLMPLARSRTHTASQTTLTRAPRRRRLKLALASGALLLVGAAIAGSVVMRQPTAEQAAVTGVACAETVDEAANLTIVPADGRSPVTICAALWSKGDISARSTGPVPPLSACLTPEGAVMVYPTVDPAVCGRFGFSAQLPDGYERMAERLARLRSALDGQLSAAGACRSLADATAIARRELRRADLADWTVATDAHGDACAYYVLDAQTRSVVIV